MVSLIHSPTIETYTANLDFFKDFAPEIHDKISANGSGEFKFVSEGEEDFDIEIRGGRFYAGGAIAITENQIKEFWNNQPNRIFLKPEQDVNGVGVVNQFFKKITKRAVDAEISFYEDRCDLRSYHLIICGIGLGVHLPILLDLLQCRALTIVEADLDLLQASLYTLDWRSFNDYFSRRPNGHLNLIVTDDVSTAYDYVRSIVKFQTAPAFLDGFCLFQHYGADLFSMLGAKIFEAPKELFSNFGFLYDDMNMVQNTYFNLRDNNPIIFQSASKPEDLKAFIVGAGPSLDASIAAIRKNQEKALIISCGTALSALLAYGIRPDFHVELENTPDIFEETEKLQQRFGLSGICLVGSTSIFPNIAELFDTVILFFRRGVASDPMFRTNDSAEIPYCGPEVGNLGTSLASALGCQTAYFFGMDFGAIDPDQHYSKNTNKGLGVLHYPWQKLNLERPGNFGGTAYTNSRFIESLTFLEEDVRYNKVISRYFNCSDGIAIAGAAPLRPDDVSLPGSDKSKADKVSEIIERCTIYSRDIFEKKWDGDVHLDANLILRTHLLAIINASKRDYDGVIEGLYQIADAMPLNTKKAEILLYRGSMISALATAYFLLCRTGSEEDRMTFSGIIREEMVVFIESMFHRVEAFYQQLHDPRVAVMGDYIEIH